MNSERHDSTRVPHVGMNLLSPVTLVCDHMLAPTGKYGGCIASMCKWSRPFEYHTAGDPRSSSDTQGSPFRCLLQFEHLQTGLRTTSLHNGLSSSSPPSRCKQLPTRGVGTPPCMLHWSREVSCSSPTELDSPLSALDLCFLDRQVRWACDTLTRRPGLQQPC